MTQRTWHGHGLSMIGLPLSPHGSQAGEALRDVALGWALYDAQWRTRFEPLPDLCSTADSSTPPTIRGIELLDDEVLASPSACWHTTTCLLCAFLQVLHDAAHCAYMCSRLQWQTNRPSRCLLR